MTYNELWRRLATVCGDGEAKAISRTVYEVRYGLTLPDIYLGKDTQLSADDQAELEEIALRLVRQEPVQYVLGRADFCGRTFEVTPAVLIPRPETEELCRWVVEAESGRQPRLLDVGTGSGCIAVTLAAEMGGSAVTAWDISPEALAVARRNAKRAGVQVSFEQQDALNTPSPEVPQWDIIVSNPPYICNKERARMEPNVLDYEPHGALFVPDDDPLLFYRAIARYACTALTPGGSLFFEINPLYAESLGSLLASLSYRGVETRQDQYGKTRFIRATR